MILCGSLWFFVVFSVSLVVLDGSLWFFVVLGNFLEALGGYWGSWLFLVVLVVS